MRDVSRETEHPDRDVVRQLFGASAARAYRYASLLAGPGVQRGLLGPREAARLWPRHLLNCAVVAPAFGAGALVCDLGSGAGLPGVVLALARPDLSVVLLEPLLRRATFLEEVIAELPLTNARVRRARAEDAAPAAYDVVTARAVAPLDTLATWAIPLLRTDGELIAVKGASAAAELAAAQPALQRLGANRGTVETYGHGLVDPPTTVVRVTVERQSAG